MSRTLSSTSADCRKSLDSPAATVCGLCTIIIEAGRITTTSAAIAKRLAALAANPSTIAVVGPSCILIAL